MVSKFFHIFDTRINEGINHLKNTDYHAKH